MTCDRAQSSDPHVRVKKRTRRVLRRRNTSKWRRGPNLFDRPEDHRRHVLVVAGKTFPYRGRRRQGVRARRRLGEIQVGTIEEHAGVAHALGGERSIGLGRSADVGTEEAVNVIVVPGDSALLAQLAPVFEPSASPVEDDHLVPERAAGVDGRYVVETP